MAPRCRLGRDVRERAVQTTAALWATVENWVGSNTGEIGWGGNNSIFSGSVTEVSAGRARQQRQPPTAACRVARRERTAAR